MKCEFCDKEMAFEIDPEYKCITVWECIEDKESGRCGEGYVEVGICPLCKGEMRIEPSSEIWICQDSACWFFVLGDDDLQFFHERPGEAIAAYKGGDRL